MNATWSSTWKITRRSPLHFSSLAIRCDPIQSQNVAMPNVADFLLCYRIKEFNEI